MRSDLPPAAAGTAEGQWVEGELVRSLMRTQRNSQWLGVLLIPIFVGVLWAEVDRILLLAWALLATGVGALRFWVLHRYTTEVLPQGVEAHRAFLRRHGIVWPASAFVWGLTSALYFDRSSLSDQFICWLILAGLAMFAMNMLSSHLGTMRNYLNTLAATVLAVMAWRMGVELQFYGPFYHWWLLLLVVLFWLVLHQSGNHLHATLRRNFELQYRNNQLIESLTRQTQAALDAVEIKNRFLASAAHDIRQPVHALGLYADWLGSEPDLVREIAPKIVESTKAVNQLFDSLFDLARLDSGKIKLNIEQVDVQKLLNDLAQQFRPLAEAKGLQLRVRCRPSIATTDPILLRRIVGNLLSNAIRYTQRGGVLLAGRQTPEGPRIEVWDTGVGIAPVYQREIFREFYKVPNHPGTEEGFGLGLNIVSRLTRILGHPLSLASRPGRGTVFRVLLVPTDARAAAERAVAALSQLVRRP